jgi:Zn-dependent membrane protease YugP
MTGARFCRRLLERRGIAAEVVRGSANCYVAGERLIVLRPHCHDGTSRQHLTLVAHEVGHAEQEHRMGSMAPALRWVLAGRLWLEWDASRRARRLMAEEGFAVDEEALRDSWRGYLQPALWQMGLMLVVAIAAMRWRLR